MKGSSIIGRVVPIPKGDWNSSNTYKKLDIVYNEGKSYIAKKEVPASILLNNNEYWQILAEGTLGLNGPQGPTGATGPTGNVYLPVFDVDFNDGILYVYQYEDGPYFEIDSKGDLYMEIRSQ